MSKPLPRIVASEVLARRQREYKIQDPHKTIESDFEHPEWDDQYRTAILKTTDQKYQLWTYAELRRYSAFDTLINVSQFVNTVCASTVWFLGKSKNEHTVLSNCIQSVINLMLSLSVDRHSSMPALEYVTCPDITLINRHATSAATRLVSQTVSVDDLLFNQDYEHRDKAPHIVEDIEEPELEEDDEEPIIIEQEAVENVIIEDENESEVEDDEDDEDDEDAVNSQQHGSATVIHTARETVSDAMPSMTKYSAMKDKPKSVIDYTLMLCSYAGIYENNVISIREIDTIADIYFRNTPPAPATANQQTRSTVATKSSIFEEHERSYDVHKGKVVQPPNDAPQLVVKVGETEEFHAPFIVHKPNDNVMGTHVPEVIFVDHNGKLYATSVYTMQLMSALVRMITNRNAILLPPTDSLFIDMNLYNRPAKELCACGLSHDTCIETMNSSEREYHPFTHDILNIFRSMSRLTRLKYFKQSDSIWFLDKLPTMQMNLNLFNVERFLGPIAWYRKWYVNGIEADHNELSYQSTQYIFLEFMTTVNELEKYYDNIQDLTPLINMYRPVCNVPEDLRRACPGEVSNVMTIVIYGRYNLDVSKIHWMRYDDTAYVLTGESKVKYNVRTEYVPIPIQL